ncbi:MAG: carboxypeptidase-like regulatory domain-containing protein [Methanomassiliicoccales archaeon]|nr:carboxypeptidase-like regulatory domain-containing protein [Methanomassiliicoccales archaeon]
MKNLTAVLICALLLGCLIPAFPAASAAESFFVTGQVRDASGNPLSGANVSASNTTTGTTYFAFTNEAGVYNISLPIGLYNLSASKVNYSISQINGLFVGPNNVVGIDLILNEILGRVFGFIISGNISVDGVTVTLSNAKQNFTSQSVTPFGMYSIEGVDPGIYVARAEKPGYFTAYSPDPVIVTRGNGVQVNFTLKVQPARVFGAVSLAGNPEADVTVELLLSGILLGTAQTDAFGNYSFGNLKAGEYQLRLSKEGLVEKTVSVSLEPFEDKRVDPVMARSPVEGLKGFIGDLDLTHSLMIVAMLVIVILMAFGVFIRMRSAKRPDMLANEEKEEEDREKKTKKK